MLSSSLVISSAKAIPYQDAASERLSKDKRRQPNRLFAFFVAPFLDHDPRVPTQDERRARQCTSRF
jgi:hypothetical protein